MGNPEKRPMTNSDADQSNTDDPTHAQETPGTNNKPSRIQFPDKSSTSTPGGSGQQTTTFFRQDPDLRAPGYASSIVTDDGEDSEEYDWSAEEDLVDEAAKFESQMGVSRRGWGLRSVLSLLFTSLVGSIFLAGLLITPALIVHYYWYVPNPTPTRQNIKDNIEAWLFWAAANLIISWFLAMIIDIIPVLVRFFLSATWGHVSESVKTRIEIYDSVKNTAKPAFYAGSGYASWVIIFAGIYKLYNESDPGSSKADYTGRMVNVIQFFFFLILVWCAQRMLSHFVAFSFHRTAYKERIEEVGKALSVIEKLRQCRPKAQITHQYNKTSSGRPTPLLGLGGPAFSEKQHFKALSGALEDVAPPLKHGDSAGTISVTPMMDEGHDGDVEDHGHEPEHERDWTLVEDISRRKKRKRPPIRNLKKEQDEEKEGDKKQHPVADAGRHPDGSTTRPSQNRHVSEPALFTPREKFSSYLPARHTDIDGGTTNTSSGNHGLPTGAVTFKQAAKVLTNAVLHDARNLSNTSGDFGRLTWNVNSAHEAKRLARSIYTRFKAPGRTWLVPSDFYPAYHDQAAAEEAFRVFDKDNNRDTSRAEIKTTVLKVYKERRFLSRSMRDVGQALSTLNRILMFFAAVVVFFISLSVFGVQIGTSLSSIYSLGIAASFIFKNSASSAFDAIMFLFVMHPYDTGDRVFVDQENLVVKKVGLFATIFQRSDGTETYYFNSQLFTKFIINVRRSGKTWENLTMQVAWTTPLTKLDALEKCINEWLSTEDFRWFEPSTNITLQHIKYQRYLELTIGIGHNGNWQDWGLRQARKTAFHAAVQYYCQELGITGWESPIPVVFVDSKTMSYHGPSADDNVLSPTTLDSAHPAGDGGLPDSGQMSKEEAIEAVKDMKPTLGFLPPLAVRSSHLLRARKSRHRKANLGASNIA